MKKISSEFVRSVAERVCEVYGIPSAVLMVADDDGVYSACTGEATLKSEFVMASVSKSFLATAILVAQNEGQLDIDKPIKTYIPELKLYDEYLTDHLTIRDALSHKSGLSRRDLLIFAGKSDDMEARIKRLAYHEPVAELRQTYYYNNNMYDLCTAVLERASGMSQIDFVTEKLLKPLGMDHTLVKADDKAIQGYTRTDAGLVPAARGDRPLGLCGGIGSTGEDMIKWIEFHRKGDERILPDKLREELYTPQTIIPEEPDFPEVSFSNCGLGFEVCCYKGHKLISHDGNINGYRLAQGFVPEAGFSYIWLSNLDGGPTPTVVAYTLIDRALGLGDKDWAGDIAKLSEEARAEAGAAEGGKPCGGACEELPADWRNILGVYEDPGSGRLTVEEAEGRPVLRMDAGVCPMRFCGGWIAGTQVLFGMDTPMSFEPDGSLVCNNFGEDYRLRKV